MKIGIVKLFLRFAGQEDSAQPWAMATGWLIRPDLLVTAGHCAYDWSHDLGNLTHVKAYIGYAGQETVSDPDYAVQFRTGKSIATTSLWLSSGSNKPRDVSFIKLSSPFEGVTSFNFKSTPMSGSFSLGVVGYPGDLQKQKTGEKGACMYEMFLKTTFDISKSAYHMLEYVIDTFGGKSRQTPLPIRYPN
jgi:V8-like Glu-specific endopeptidase